MNYAVAAFLNKNYDVAISTVDTLIDGDDDSEPKAKLKPYPRSELIFLGIRARERGGKHNDALKMLRKYKS